MPGIKGMKWVRTPERDARREAGIRKKLAYQRWRNMMARCYNQEHPKYRLYGARGITVDEPWHDFDTFYLETGDAPEGLSFDRVDNDGPYSPSNWRWASDTQQLQNRRKTGWHTHQKLADPT